MSESFNRNSANIQFAITLHQQGLLEKAKAIYLKLIELDPKNADALHLLGVISHQNGNHQKAIDLFNQAIDLKPDLAAAYSNKGVALYELKQFRAAIASYDKAISLNSNYAEAYCNRGNALQELMQFNDAVVSYDKTILLKPSFAQAYSNRGNALLYLKQFEVAIASYDKAISLQSDLEYLIGMRQHAKMQMCDWQDFELNVLEITQKIKSKLKVSTCLPLLALPTSLHEQHQAAETWCLDKFPSNSTLGLIPKSSRQPKIKIGYFSGDFHVHPVSLLTIGLFEHHDKSRFELFAFSFGPNIQDEIRGRINNAFDRFIDVRDKSDNEVAALSRALGIDIAVDLSGHTLGARTGIFSFRAAPIQLSYIGYLGTMGAEYYDYLIADQTLIPKESQVFYAEKIAYLPSYQVNDNKQAIPETTFSRDELKLPKGDFVYCCFNSNYKITPSTFDSWMRILKSVPQSVLLLYSGIEIAEINLKLEAKKRGVDPDRLIFGGRLPRNEYLTRFRSADLFLDTLPYNAGATASDSLWSGLPVLTCTGESFASRYAASLLSAIGLPELVTKTQDEFEALAIELATNPFRLKAIKEKLEKNRLMTLLFDTPRFAKHIEAAFTEMYERYQADLPPDHIYVSDVNLSNV